MPVHTMPLSRRSFLCHSAAVAAGLVVVRHGWSADSRVDAHRFALLSDTHIPDSPDVVAHETNMTANLRHVVSQLTRLEAKPAGVLINGDCAYLKGLPADYTNLSQLLAPLSEAGMPIHLTMGNHDDRAPLYDALKAQKPTDTVVASKHLLVIESPRANWFLLDSLKEVNLTTGELGAAQRQWLDKALTDRADKPAIVMVHHNPQFDPPAEGKAWGGIQDTADLMELLGRHRQVKALVFGHTHNWSIARRGNLHLVNLPPVAYVFTAGRPNGWVQAELTPTGLSLQLNTIDAGHKQNGERIELAWL